MADLIAYELMKSEVNIVCSRFNLSSNNMKVTITISKIKHTAGNLNIVLQRSGLWGFSGVGSSRSFNSATLTREFTAGDSGTYRLYMWNQNANGTNEGSISVSWRK